MTLDEIIRNLEDQAEDRDSSVDKDDPDCIFRRDAAALREAVNLLTELAEFRKTGLPAADIQEAVNIINDAMHPDSLPAELKSWVERCVWHVKKCVELHEESTALKEKNTDLTGEVEAAKFDIAALLWLDGRCEYCAHGQKVSYSGASRWTCKLGGVLNCRPEWRGRCRNDR